MCPHREYPLVKREQCKALQKSSRKTEISAENEKRNDSVSISNGHSTFDMQNRAFSIASPKKCCFIFAFVKLFHHLFSLPHTHSAHTIISIHFFSVRRCAVVKQILCVRCRVVVRMILYTEFQFQFHSFQLAHSQRSDLCSIVQFAFYISVFYMLLVRSGFVYFQ